MFKSVKKLLIVLLLSVLMISMVTATAYAVSTPKSIDKQDTGIVKIESKEKTTKYKITWNGNGGKIGSKKTVTTTVKKASKIGKLITPKRSNYSFKGWYTKKTGGTKIGKNTKPKKSLTYYALWTKKGSTSTNSKIVGDWKFKIMEQDYGSSVLMFHEYYFYNDGKFTYYKQKPTYVNKIEGKYSVSNGKVYFKQRKFYDADVERGVKITKLKYRSYESIYGLMGDMTSTYTVGSDKSGFF